MRLTDLGGLGYAKINDILTFDNLKFALLSKLNKDVKRRLKKDNE